MRKILIIANWKMYLSNQASLTLAESLVQSDLEIPPKLEVVLCPSHNLLASLDNIHDRRLKLGAQDVFWENQGAYTGEVGPESLKDLGCEYVIVGHSERREYLGETSGMINRKVKAALKAGMKPILCVGEKLEVRKAGLTEEKVSKQLMASLKDIDLPFAGQLIIAYEPLWAIYPSKLEVDPVAVEKIAKIIEAALIELFGHEVYAEKCRIIYGGSVNSGNIGKFLSLTKISGALIGHSSTELTEFVNIIRNSAE